MWTGEEKNQGRADIKTDNGSNSKGNAVLKMFSLKYFESTVNTL